MKKRNVLIFVFTMGFFIASVYTYLHGAQQGAAPQPIIKQVVPIEVPQGAEMDIIIRGSKFADGATVSFSGGIIVNSTTFDSAKKLIVNISVPSAESLGKKKVTVTNPTGKPGIKPNALGVVEGVPTTPPAFKAGDTIPGYTLKAPWGSRAEIKASGSYSSGQWTVFMTRALKTSATSEDVQFDGIGSGSEYYFSVGVLNNAKGTVTTMAVLDGSRYILGNESSTTANLKAKNETPTSASTFTGTEFITTGNSAEGVPPVTLKAAYDSKNLYILTTWSDSTEDLKKDQWSFDGTTWTRKSMDTGYDEDRVAIWWDMADSTHTMAQGCANLCHLTGGSTGQGRMGTKNSGEIADLWHWKAARWNPLNFADDQYGIYADPTNTSVDTRKSDTGGGIDSSNSTGTPAQPAFMAEDDPGANANFLMGIPSGAKRAITFTP